MRNIKKSIKREGPKKEKGHKKREKAQKKRKEKKMREKERRDNVTILCHTCASK